MKDLDELRESMTALPSLFAEDAPAADVSQLDSADGSAASFAFGFPGRFSAARGDGGLEILRKDMNAVGQLATGELRFKQAGGWHTYSGQIATGLLGYPERALLWAYDGSNLFPVESQEPGVQLAFADNDGIADFRVIGSLVKDVGEGDEAPKRVLWKAVGRVGGLDSGQIRLKIDYTRIRLLEDGGTVGVDSLVVGTAVNFLTIDKPELINKIQPCIYGISSAPKLYHKTTITTTDGTTYEFERTNKGRYGEAFGAYPYFKPSTGTPVGLPVCSFTGGTGNYFFSFFAPAGTSVAAAMKSVFTSVEENIPKKVQWWAIPVEAEVSEDEEVAE